MKSLLKCFYCYMKEGQPFISEIEPDNFDELPFKKAYNCANEAAAALIYTADLKIINIQKGEK